MKFYVADWNGVLTDFKEKVKSHLSTPRDADAWVVWQDCQGSYGDLLSASKKLYHKPTYCVQHGKGATRDYDKPNSFPLNADRYLCWGLNDYNRMCRLGYEKRTTIVGCPLISKFQPKAPYTGKKVLFVPVNTGKEEPENIAAYYELMSMKYEQAKLKILSHKQALTDKWGFEGRNAVDFKEISTEMEVIAKLLPWHDKPLYHGTIATGYQDQSSNNSLLFRLLSNVDVVVGIDEGTTEAFAYGHDVPVIIVKGFEYRQFDKSGRHFSAMKVEPSKAATVVDLCDLKEAVAYALAHPEHKREERKEQAELELGVSYGNATENIYKIIKNDAKNTGNSSIPEIPESSC